MVSLCQPCSWHLCGVPPKPGCSVISSCLQELFAWIICSWVRRLNFVLKRGISSSHAVLWSDDCSAILWVNKMVGRKGGQNRVAGAGGWLQRLVQLSSDRYQFFRSFMVGRRTWRLQHQRSSRMCQWEDSVPACYTNACLHCHHSSSDWCMCTSAHNRVIKCPWNKCTIDPGAIFCELFDLRYTGMFSVL